MRNTPWLDVPHGAASFAGRSQEKLEATTPDTDSPTPPPRSARDRRRRQSCFMRPSLACHCALLSRYALRDGCIYVLSNRQTSAKGDAASSAKSITLEEWNDTASPEAVRMDASALPPSNLALILPVETSGLALHLESCLALRTDPVFRADCHCTQGIHSRTRP